MPLLDEVLNFKKYQDQQNNAELNALAPAIMSLVQGRQQRQTNLLDQFKLQGELAKSGIGADINMDKGLLSLFKRSDLISPKDQADIDLKNSQTSYYNILPRFFSEKDGGSGILDGDSSAPPGTTLNVKGLNIPLNPKLTESEQASVAGAQTLRPSLDKIKEMLGQGILKETDISDVPGSLTRTAAQAALDAGIPALFAGNKEMQSLQSELNNLKSQLPFVSGGKQLTGTEKDLVFKLLNTAGKSNKQIGDDLEKAFSILQEKEKLALGGANAAGKSKVKASGEFPEFASAAEAEKANLPKGTVVMIGGRKARID